MTPPNDSPELDLALIQQALAGEVVASRALAERLQCVARHVSAENARLGRPLNEHDLADVVQDTVLVVLRKLGEFRGEGSLEAWACKVCRFELMNAIRRRRRQPRLADEELLGVGDEAVAREWQRLLAREALEAAIARIGGAEAEALRLRHFEDLSFEVMAARSGVSIAGIKARYYRGLTRLEQIVVAREREQEEGRRGNC